MKTSQNARFRKLIDQSCFALQSLQECPGLREELWQALQEPVEEPAQQPPAASPPNDGGPAFPVSTGTGPLSDNFVSPGMSLRDYFAACAFQTLILADEPPNWPAIAARAYDGAEAMLKERGRKL